MIWIEILGPSGVGKSYWYEKFVQKYSKFEPKRIVLDNIRNSSEFGNLSYKIKFLFWIYSMDIYKTSNYVKHKLFDFFFKGFQRKSKSIFTDEDDVIIKKYLVHIDSLNEPQIVVLKKICYFHQKLIEFKFYQHYMGKKDIYLAEDGLIHLSPIFIEEMKADGILIFEKEYENLLTQRLNRAKIKPTTFIEYLLEENDLKFYVEDYYKLYETKINSTFKNVKSSKIKSIDLDQADVIKEMYDFISEIKTS